MRVRPDRVHPQHSIVTAIYESNKTWCKELSKTMNLITKNDLAMFLPKAHWKHLVQSPIPA